MSTFTDHPVLKEMLDYKSKNPNQTMLAFTTYLEFCEGKYIMWNVEHKFLSSLDLIVLTASRKNTADVEVHLPISSQMEISPEWMKQVNQHVQTLTGIDKVNIVLCEGDSKCVGYTIQSGLPADTPEESGKQVSNDKQLTFIKEKLLKKYAQNIHDAAIKNSQSENVDESLKTDERNEVETDGMEIGRDGDNISTKQGDVNVKEDVEIKEKQNTQNVDKIETEGEIKTLNEVDNKKDESEAQNESCKKNIKEDSKELISEKKLEDKEKPDEDGKNMVRTADENNLNTIESKDHQKAKNEEEQEIVNENQTIENNCKTEPEEKKINDKEQRDEKEEEVKNHNETVNEKKENSTIRESKEHETNQDQGKKDESLMETDVDKENVRKHNENNQDGHEKLEEPSKQVEPEAARDKEPEQNKEDKTGSDKEDGVRPDEEKASKLENKKSGNQTKERATEKIGDVQKEKVDSDIDEITQPKEKKKKETQEVVEILSSSEEEDDGSRDEDDDNNDEDSSDDEDSDSSDVIEVSDSSDTDTEQVPNKKSDSVQSSDSESNSSSSNSDIEEIQVVKSSNNKISKFKHRSWNERKKKLEKKSDDLEVLYEVDDRKSLFASQVVEVVYSNSLDADSNENDSANKQEDVEDAVEIIFEKEGKSKDGKNKRPRNRLNEQNKFSSKKKRYVDR